MRIAMVSEHASPLAALGGVDAGGQNVHVAALAAELAGAGHDVAVYTRRDDPAAPERVQMLPGVQVVHVPAGPAAALPKDELLPHMDAFGRWMARDWAARGAPDVVHSHFWMSGLAALRAARATAVPVAHTFHALGSVKRRHQGAADTSPPQRVRLESELGRRVDLVIATCSDEVTELARLGVPEDRVQVVPCGVDVQHFVPGDDAGAGHGPHRLLCVGRLVERKGVDTVLAALGRLPSAELVVAGGPPAAHLSQDPEARRLRGLARDLGVAGRVHLTGAVPHAQMPALLRSADVVVATPWYEPFGIVPLEAAACGRPLVGSAVGGLLDTVVDDVTGVLVPPRDPAALAAALGSLLADPARRERYGAAARRRAVARYGWDQVATATEAAYGTVLSAVVKEASA
ncbi:glycosyltransferase [Georgenia yuyongxinii]|uniref:D-inositol 3-phosphate glycosyltransferase n=1 Tax=Georgenia yuyongxinii TaxID=2589797 RepID=A0A552WPM3_9MICO|nr:glycosyltransferase [Georgenia yuyongxinii]TRW44732.1 glycosyltransferase family 1 protein [Georgenia yuyongxinii]